MLSLHNMIYHAGIGVLKHYKLSLCYVNPGLESLSSMNIMIIMIIYSILKET